MGQGAVQTAGIIAGKVSHTAFLSTTWAFTGVSLSFVVIRLIARARHFRRIYWDDVLVIASWLMLLSTAIIWQVKSPVLYEQFDMVRGERLFYFGFLAKFEKFLRMNVPWLWFFYTSLWFIKLSFLIFFRRIGANAKGHRVWWWTVLIITVLSWIPCVADIDYRCTTKPILYIYFNCNNKSAIRYQYRTLIANCILDVFTDILILTIPILLLWNVRISRKNKIILFSLFSATIIVMIIAIVRVAVVNSPHQNSDMSWLYLWVNIEMGAAIMVACAASFRQLFTNPHSTSEYPSARSTPAPGARLASRHSLFSFWHSASTLSGRIATSASEKWPGAASHTESFSSTEKPSWWQHGTPRPRWPPGERPEISWPCIAPMNGVRVHKTVDVSHTALDTAWTRQNYEITAAEEGRRPKRPELRGVLL